MGPHGGRVRPDSKPAAHGDLLELRDARIGVITLGL